MVLDAKPMHFVLMIYDAWNSYDLLLCLLLMLLLLLVFIIVIVEVIIFY